MASNDTPKTILLKGHPIQYEAVAGGSITPGMLLAMESDGEVIAHNDDAPAVACPALFAREQEWTGGAIDDAYAAGDRVPYYHCRSGDMVFALLADEANVAIGAFLESNGLGHLQAATTGIPVVQAMEAVNNVGGTGPVRIKARVL